MIGALEIDRNKRGDSAATLPAEVYNRSAITHVMGCASLFPGELLKTY